MTQANEVRTKFNTHKEAESVLVDEQHTLKEDNKRLDREIVCFLK